MQETLINTQRKITAKRNDFLQKTQNRLFSLDAIIIENEIKNQNESVGKFGQHPTDPKPTRDRGDSNV